MKTVMRNFLMMGLLFFFCSTATYAEKTKAPEPIHSKNWFGAIGTGYSWTNSPQIKNQDPAVWTPSIQGYNSRLSNEGFYTFALRKKVHQNVDVSLSYLNNERFNSQKFQTSPGSSTQGGEGSRMRYFELSNRSLMVNGFLHPAQHLYDVLGFALTPYAGAGIGYARNQVHPFQSVVTEVVEEAAIGSIDNFGNNPGKSNFTWQGTFGFDVHPKNSSLSVDMGYRYFGGGSFSGPSNVYSNASGWALIPAWIGRLTANQLFVELKYTV